MSYISINRYWSDKLEKKSHSDLLGSLLSKVEDRRLKRQSVIFTPDKDSSLVINNGHVKDGKFGASESQIEKVKIKRGNGNNNSIAHLKADDISLTAHSTANIEEQFSNDSTSNNFTFVKKVEIKKNKKIKCVLPSWLANPSIVSVDLKNLEMAVTDIPELDQHLVDKLQQNNISHFFPVQSQLIPWILKFHQKSKNFWPRDVCVSAPTGSGKTLAFVLPILQLLKNQMTCDVRGLIVLPTKDLAFQVSNVFKKYSGGTNTKVIYLGNDTWEKEKHKIVTKDEILGYRSLVDIIVTTPGRLVEHLKYTKGLSFTKLRFLVIDEADHVMDSVQNDWLKHLQTRLPPFGLHSEMPYLTLANITNRPPRTQKLLFSATLSQDPEKLKQLNLFQPCLFTSTVKPKEEETEKMKVSNGFIGKYSTPTELKEWVTVCPLSIKPLVLYHIIKQNKWKHILCFADSVSNVHKLSCLLRLLNSLDLCMEPLNIVEISSKLTNEVHREIFDKFSKNKVQILVTTDTLARGIDLQNVEYVVLYDAPKFMKNYIHRVGRTGRAGKKGTSLVLITPDQKEYFENMMNSFGKADVKELNVPLDDLRNLESIYKNALNILRTELKNEKTEERKTNVSRRRKRKKT